MDGRPAAARPSMVLVATGLGLFMIFLDATIVNVAPPDIQSEFDTGEQGLQWVVAAYSLTMGMFMMSAATFSDARGDGSRTPAASSCSAPPRSGADSRRPSWC
jgi:MFS family permease